MKRRPLRSLECNLPRIRPTSQIPHMMTSLRVLRNSTAPKNPTLRESRAVPPAAAGKVRRALPSLVCVLALGANLFAQAQGRRNNAGNTNLLQSDFPFQGACISAKYPQNNTALKGLALRV